MNIILIRIRIDASVLNVRHSFVCLVDGARIAQRVQNASHSLFLFFEQQLYSNETSIAYVRTNVAKFSSPFFFKYFVRHLIRGSSIAKTIHYIYIRKLMEYIYTYLCKKKHTHTMSDLFSFFVIPFYSAQ